MDGALIGARRLVAAAALGSAAGVALVVLFTIVPPPWDALVNTSALWGLVPFAVAARSPHGRGVAVGVASMLALVLVWILLSPNVITVREVLVFVLVGLGAGAVCGAAGAAVGRDRRVSGTVVMAGIVLGEAVYGTVVVGGPHWFVEAALAGILVTACCRTAATRVRAGLGAAAVAGALFGAYWAYDAVLTT
ncbi:hypothetical protein HQ308_19090 [Rhodococcus sp. BP-241]|uniref:DUF6518 family protein n=1 Tax=Rhodococcus sp. BP-241 TaxID=2739441 RepID=UPI001C9B8E5E|nr:DUF6518 family protein [Rhodococcus sp. BP-241]MBY6708902.1 hypothetical protein [Rhodococcus sp. BP-241]